VMRSFPDIAAVRRVYQAFADMHRIALGAGALEQYPIDLRGIASRTDLTPATVAHAFKALELDGALVLSEGARTPSRVFIHAGHHAVQGMRMGNERLAPLIECLLRLYGGLFEEAAVIEEERIAPLIHWSTTKVVEGLQELERLELLSYRKRSEDPTATLLVPRRDAQLLMLERDSLDARKERAVARLEAMMAYAFGPVQCRTRTLLDYFGEPLAADCGVCDRCKARREEGPPPPGVPDPGTVVRERWQQDEDRSFPS